MSPTSSGNTFTPLILDRLIADGHADERWSYCVLAACEGPAELSAVLNGSKALAPRPSRDAAGGTPPEPPGAYLSSISVEGFRGIGPRATLRLPPGPGLTLVVGRNGSGKSSFAEALELLLTGGNRRWDGRSSVWKDGWRSLHQPNPCSLQSEFHVEDRGPVTVTRQWAEGAELDENDAWFQEKGKPRRPYGELGWDAASEVHRPLLPYAELGTVFDNPSDIHDALARVLGLGELDEIVKTLQTERKAREARVQGASATLLATVSRLDAIAAATGDARAQRCLAALTGKKRRLDEVEAVLESDGDASADPAVAILRAAHVPAPAREAVEQAAAAILEAVAAVDRNASTDAGRARDLAKLLEQALQFHGSHGGADCPVCRAPDRLGESWRDATTAELARLRTEAVAAEQSHVRLEQAVANARRMLAIPRKKMAEVASVGLSSVNTALAAVDEWNGGASLTDPRALAAHMTARINALLAAVEGFDREVREELARREDLWRPVAHELRVWLPQGRAAEITQAHVADLKKAEGWFKGVQADVRNERFRPIADQAIALWRTLRQNSNVELGSVHLQGAATRRSVVLDVTVDGVPGAALGVMSQGELNALALSLFMPRASLPESPFRFMVIDDPVQSMDPSRVDGLARALQDAARRRQVIVFTHDERLPQAVARLGIPATVVQVTRRPGSLVETRVAHGPVEDYINDAHAIRLTSELPDEVRRRVVPGFCRSALEAACMAAIRRRRLKQGDAHQEVEALIAAQTTLYKLVALALFDDGERGSEVMGALNKRFGGWAGDVFRMANSGAHEAHDGDLESLAKQSAQLAHRLQELT